MTYVFDIDGTICSLVDGEYEKAKPLKDRIRKINELFADGHTIIYYTARGMGRHDNNRALAESRFWSFTHKQLESWGAKFHVLRLGKPSGDIYIDDKGIKDEDFFAD
jgi:isochorismate hydrolase